jgi:RNA polymerase sigma factor (sigma-70 family)
MTALALQAPTTFVITPRVKAIQPNPTFVANKTTAVQLRQEMSDEELISAICSHAEWAIEILYQRYHRYAYSLAYHILRDNTAAEDVVQEVFLSIWQKAASYQRQNGSVHRWLQAIVHHRAIDKVRAATHRDYQWTPLQVENEQDPPSEEPELWEQAWQGEQQKLIRAALEHLPPDQRLVIEQAYFGGYTHAEIAEQWHIPLGTVKGRMRLGLLKMKRLLQEQGLEMAM